MKNLRIIGTLLLLFAVLVSCVGCFGYATRLPNNTFDKVDKVVLGVNEDEYVLESKYHNSDMYEFVPVIEDMVGSGKIDISNAFGQVKMSCDDSSVEYAKETYELWFELLIKDGKYKKLFFTMNKNDIQTIWIYATKTDSYDDGRFLEYYACDCKELVELAAQYAKSIKGIEGATKIEITKYGIGEVTGAVTLTDEVSIKHIIDNLTSLKIKELEHNMPTAIEYKLTFYNENGETMKAISITLDGWVDYHGSIHSVIIGELDVGYIENCLSNVN